MKFPWQRESRIRHAANFEGVLGTSLELQVVGTSPTVGPRAEAAVLAEIDRLEAVFNAYKSASELSRWQASWDEPLPVSRELALVLAQAETWRQTTHGAFNPAVEGLTRLWSHGAREDREPTGNEIEAILEQMRGPLWEVELQNSRARRLTKLPVTLNSIAKSFIIDCACEAAVTAGGVGALINIGGDIRHLGDKAVTVAIADPRNHAENSAPIERVRLWNQGIATSGNYRRGFSVQGKWYSHVLDPRSGRPVEFMVGVSVLAPCATTADVLATAFSVLKPDESLALADSLENIGVLLIASDGTRFTNNFWQGHCA